jgi:hypothetical protein
MFNKKEEEEKALTVTGSTDMVARPDFIKQDDRRGTEHLTKDDLQMPRVALAQKMSPQLDKDSPKYIDGLEMGDLFNNITGYVYGKGPIEFTVVRADKPRGMEFKPMEEGGGIIDFNVPLDDPRMHFGPEGEKPTATKFYDFLVMLLPSTELAVLSFKDSGIKVAKQLNTLISMRNAACFAGNYALSSSKDQNAKGTFAVYQVKNAGWVTKDIYEKAEATFEKFRDKELKVERTDEGEAEEFNNQF